MLALGLIAGGSACTTGDLGPAPFVCTPQAPDCPSGYHCNSRFCVRDGSNDPVPLTTTIADDVTAYSVHPRTSDLLVCWRQSVSSRDPGIHGAVVSPTGVVTQTETALYTGDTNSVALISDVAGDCAQIGDNTVLTTTRLAGTENYLERMFVVDIASGASRNPSNVQFHRHGFNYYTLANVGDQVWLIDSGNISSGDDRRAYYVTTIDSTLTQSPRQHLELPALLADREILSTDVHGGDGGAWVGSLFRNGQTEFAWLTPAFDTQFYIAQVLPQYVAAYPIAVRGTQLAAAYNVEGNSWQIFWISPGPMDPNDPTHSGSMVTPGPTIEMADGVLRPGAVADGDRLVLAGATDTDHVTIWTTPWGTAQPLQQIETVSKISHVVPRRLNMAVVAGHLIATWTERVPASTNGFPEYTVLYENALTTPAETSP